MSLSTPERLQLRDALKDAFNISGLRQLLFFRLGKNLEDYGVGTRDQVILGVIAGSEMEGWTDDLVLQAQEENPGNSKLKAFAAQYLRYQQPDQELERIIDDTNSFLDIAEWRTKLGELEFQVCSIELKGNPTGTGFLIGEDLVMTNYHVIEDLLGEEPKVSAARFRARFDYKLNADGEEVNKGVTYRLNKEDWLLDTSSYAPWENFGIEAGSDQEPDDNQLDYAVIRLAAKEGVNPGNENIGSQEKPKSRGWIKLPTKQPEIAVGHPLLIIQHPMRKPLKLAINMNSILEKSDTRLKYKTNTEPGSSGSPCFNSDWELIALHHAGGKEEWNQNWNRGVPIGKIATRFANTQAGAEA